MRTMRDLESDLKQLDRDQDRRDLSDTYLESINHHPTRAEMTYAIAFEYSYGITFVESDIAREWLERAIKAESELKRLAERNKRE